MLFVKKYWPRSIVNGVDTFGTVYTWFAGQGVLEDHAHQKIYKQLGMKISDMKKQDYSNLDYTYMHLNGYSAPNGAITASDIRSYITDYSPTIYPLSKNVFNIDPLSTVNLNPDSDKGTINAKWDENGWITSDLVYQPTELTLVDNSITNQQILQKVRDISYTDIFYNPYETSRLTGLAMLDLNTNAVFETQLRVVSTTIAVKDSLSTSLNIGKSTGVKTIQVKYVKAAHIELKFRRVTDVALNSTIAANVTTYLTLVDTKVENLIPVTTVARMSMGRGGFNTSLLTSKASMVAMGRSLNSSLNKQLVIMANWVNPYPNDHTMLVTDDTLLASYYADSSDTYVKIDGLINLPPKEFKKTFVSLIKFDYKVHEKKGHWYDKVVSIVIVIIAIAVAYFSAGTLSWASAALIASVAAVAEGLWAMYLVKNGGSSSAIHFTMGVSNALGVIAMISGIAAIYTSFQKALVEQELRAAITEAVAQEAAGTGTQAAVNVAAEAYVGAIQSGAASMMGSLSGTIIQGINAMAGLGSKLGILNSDVTSYIGLASGSVDGITTAFDSATKTTLDSVLNNIAEGIKTFVSKPLSEIMNQVVNWTNTAFNAYMMMVAPPNEGLADKQSQLDKSSKDVENTKPEAIENVWAMYTDPYGSIFEVGDIYDKTVPMMTSGKIKSMMTKCYDSWV